MGQFTIQPVVAGALITKKFIDGLIGSSGFRAFNQLGEPNFDDSTNIPNTALATPYANFMWNGIEHRRASATSGTSVSLRVACPVLEWSQLVSVAMVSRLPSMSATGKVKIYHSCAHTGVEEYVASLAVPTAYVVASTSSLLNGTARQLHSGDVLLFILSAPAGGGNTAITDLCIALRFKRNPIP